MLNKYWIYQTHKTLCWSWDKTYSNKVKSVVSSSYRDFMYMSDEKKRKWIINARKWINRLTNVLKNKNTRDDYENYVQTLQYYQIRYKAYLECYFLNKI